MKVLKFGGTSVGSVKSLSEVKRIVESIPGNAIVVVSALGGITDKLISTAKQSSINDSQWKKEFEDIKVRHYDIISHLVPDEKSEYVINSVNSLFSDLERNFEGVWLLRSLPDQILDVIVSFGERISSIIVAAIVNGGKRYDSLDFIKTEKWYGKNIAQIKLTENLIIDEFSSLGMDEKAIVPGFISTDASTGVITNLGRGGSDYTGALIAAAMDADVLEIWTDVDGFMTADPRIVKDAFVIDNLTFSESMDLCNFGAKVVYPPTLYPVFQKNIPIKILNTFNSEAKGTLISDSVSSNNLEIKGISVLKGLTMIVIKLISSKKEDISKRALNVISKAGINLTPIKSVKYTNELCFTVDSRDFNKTWQLIENEFAPEILKEEIVLPMPKDDLSSVAIVGKNMKSKKSLLSQLPHILEENGISVEAMSDNSDSTLLLYLNSELAPECVKRIHYYIFK